MKYFRFAQNQQLIMIKKSYIVAAALLAGLTFSFQSCGVGENDPNISFKSRTARLKGDWKLTDKTVTVTEAIQSGNNELSTIVTNGTLVGGQENVMINTGSSNVITLLRKYDFDIKFDVDGSYQYTFNVYRPTGSSNDPYDNSVYVISGVWTWLDQGKDKLGLSLSSDYSANIPDSLNPQTMLPYVVDGAYEVDRLASDELVLKRSGQFTSTIDTLIINRTFDGTFTFGR